MGAVDKIFNPIKKSLTREIQKIGDGVTAEGNKLFTQISNDISNPISSLESDITSFPDKIKKPIKTFIKTSIEDPIMKLISGIDVMITDFIRIICFLKTTPRRLHHLGNAFDNVFKGVSEEFVALGYAFELGYDSISSLVYHTTIFIDTYLKCTVKILSNSLECLPFYIIDIIGQILYIPVRVTLWAFNTFLKINLYHTEKKIWKGLLDIDKFLYTYTGIHIVKYPANIRNNCYTCVVLKDKVLKQQKENVDHTFKKKIPQQLNNNSAFSNANQQFKDTFAYPLP